MTATVPSVLRQAAQMFRDRPALLSERDGAISFAELDFRADELAKAMMADGAVSGERIAIWAPNMWEWVAAAVGVQRAGGTIVPLNTRLKGGEVADIIRRAKVTRLISIGNFLGKYYPQMLRSEQMPELKRIIVLHSDASEFEPIEEDWHQFLRRGDAISDAQLAEREAGVTEDSIADIIFTSGTTGSPKGAVFNHRTVVNGGRTFNWISNLNADDRFCVFGPFSHTASYKAGWVAALISGATVYWPESYDVVSVLDLIARHRISVMPAPPTIWQDMFDHPDWRDWDISSVRFLATGATTIPIQLMKRLQSETSIDVISAGYGMTECSGSATHTRPGDSMERVAYTVGTAVQGTEIRIADPDGRPLLSGETGEVLIRDDKLMIEYLDNPAETAMALDGDGWLHSGDIGALDEHGYLKITDRLKDMLIVGGFNVYPAEIEKQMSGIPGLSRCAIIGVPDARLGEVGHAFVVRSPGSTLTEAEVLAWSGRNLANYKAPRGVTFLDDLPTNSTGKVIKYALKTII